MNKTTAALIAIAVVIAGYFLFFKTNEIPPIIDPICPGGTILVGEGCMPVKDACELGGDERYFDEATQECLTR